MKEGSLGKQGLLKGLSYKSLVVQGSAPQKPK